MKKILLILTAVSIGIILNGCSKTPSIDDIYSEGSSQFSNGKKEQEIILSSADQTLDKLISDYSDSKENPVKKDITEEEIDDIIKDDDESSNTDDGKKRSEVSNRKELKKLLAEMFDSTQETKVFVSRGGFLTSPQELIDLYYELEREDPYDAICVESFSHGVQGNINTIKIEYSLPISQLKAMKVETHKLAEEAEKKINAYGLSEYEIVNCVNQYLCNNVEYAPSEPFPPETHTGYNAFAEGIAVCDGYSRAAKILLNDYNIECIIIHGICNGGGAHAWNMVKIADSWYHLDVTWNDVATQYDDTYGRMFFLVTDKYMRESRTWVQGDYPVSSRVPYSSKK
ncbi:MAG: transglutaminase domain-containing protein [Methanobrevibacter sp.]|nr:transglutaminase domain-containing protein [Methanobrevibacter sp.]